MFTKMIKIKVTDLCAKSSISDLWWPRRGRQIGTPSVTPTEVMPAKLRGLQPLYSIKIKQPINIETKMHAST